VPYLGICLGMQLAVIEYARHYGRFADAHSTEFNPDTPHPVIALINEWQDRTQGRASRLPRPISRHMRLGGQECILDPRLAGTPGSTHERIIERHRHRYEVNNHTAGLKGPVWW